MIQKILLLVCIQTLKAKREQCFFLKLALYSDGTLTIVKNELKKRLHLDEMTFSIMDPQERFLAEGFLKAIEERLKVRCQVRLAEIHLGVRRRLPRVINN